MNTRDRALSLSKTSVSVTFWGVRGVHPCVGPAYQIYGGHTVCTEIFLEGSDIPPTSLIFDAGSGLSDLGDILIAKKSPHRVLLFLSHVHLDHLMGIPFFKPLWHGQWTVEFYCGNLRPFGGTQSYLGRLFSPPLFPIHLSAFPGKKAFNDLDNGQLLDFGGFQLRTFALNHPDKALGFRLEVDQRSLVYVTDTEHTPGSPDQNILKSIQNADLMIYDSTYTDDTLKEHTGWGHSTWQEGVRLAQAAGVRQVCFYHHGPDHPDTTLQEIETQAQKVFPRSFMARQGQTITL